MQRVAQKSAHAFAALASLVAVVGIIGSSTVVAQSSDSSTTTINAQLCAGGMNTPSGSIAAPASGTTFGEPDQTLTITTSWVTSFDVYRDGTVVASQSNLSDSPNVTTTLNVTLPEGDSTFHLVMHGGCPASTATSANVTYTYAPDSATIVPVETSNRSPRLTGFVSRPDAIVTVIINGKSYVAINNGDGTWTLPAGTISPDLADGAYDVRVIATIEGEEVSNILTPDAVTIDTKAPTGSLITTETDNRSPELKGTVSDPRATVTITVNGQTYTANNNGDGTWTLPAGVIAELANGTYDLVLTITDPAGNTSTYTHQLTIKAPDEIGFILSPNTGFLRIHKLNIPSWLLYCTAAWLVLTILFVAWRKQLQKREAIRSVKAYEA